MTQSNLTCNHKRRIHFQNSRDMSCSSRPETKQDRHRTTRHVDALQLCLATDVSASLQVCPGQASQWASTCVEPKHAKSSCQMCPTHSKAIRIPSSKVREVSLGIVASAHETHSSVWWSLSSLRRLDFCINGVKENRHTRLRRVRTTSGTLNLSLKIKNEAEESGLLISRSGTWRPFFKLKDPSSQNNWCWNAEFGAPHLQYVQSNWTRSTLGLQHASTLPHSTAILYGYDMVWLYDTVCIIMYYSICVSVIVWIIYWVYCLCQVILAFEDVPSRDPSGQHLIEIYVNPLVS